MKDEIAKKQGQMTKKKVLFHRDNAPYQKYIAIMEKLCELYFKLLPHPPNLPDLATSD